MFYHKKFIDVKEAGIVYNGISYPCKSVVYDESGLVNYVLENHNTIIILKPNNIGLKNSFILNIIELDIGKTYNRIRFIDNVFYDEIDNKIPISAN